MFKRFKICCLVVLFITSLTFAFTGGDGTAGNPYQISTRADLEAVNTNLAASYILMNDIDLTGIAYTQAVIAPDTDSSTSGYQGTSFTGTFNGNGYIVRKLKITAPSKDYIGLFGLVDSGGDVSNIGIVDCEIAGGSYVGGVCGYMRVGTIKNCYSEGSIITGADAYGVGGICGNIHDATILNCYTAVSISSGDGSWGIGGICGYNYLGRIINCYSSGDISTTGESVGGLCGRNYGGAISNCYSTGMVTGLSKVGGLCGDEANAGAPISNCFWNIESSGLTISSGGKGLTTLQMEDMSTFINAGWDFIDENENGTTQVWQMSAETGYPELAIFKGYEPVELSGNGTEEYPYLIGNPAELGAVYYYNSKVHYKITTDIDLSGIRWSTAVIPVFSGNFDGNGFAIRYLNINGGGNLGMFGSLSIGGTIKNLGVVNISVSGYNFVGGLCGSNGNSYSVGGTITNCYSVGSVSGYGVIGGLCGGSFRGTISNSYSMGSVYGTAQLVGGLCGSEVNGYIQNCYSISDVSGNDRVGGLIGSHSVSSIANCYSIGLVLGQTNVGGFCGLSIDSTYTDCFWDTQESLKEVAYILRTGESPDYVYTPIYSTEGTVQGETTLGMKTESTFTDAGWDFVSESINGTEDTWTILDSYPYLAWQSQFNITFNPGTNGTVTEGNIVQTVPLGWSAIAPKIAANPGWVFTGWDTDFRSVGADLTVSAIYELFVGEGTIENPYQISTQSLLEIININLAAHYILTNDIDLAGIIYTKAVIAPDTSTSSGFQGTAFTGSFNGNGFKIKNLTINGGANDYIGLFGQIGSGGMVKNLGIEGGDISGRNYIGGLAGSGGTNTNCYTTGSVNGANYVGGLTGSDGTNTNCYTTGSVNGASDVGGLVGRNFSSTNTNCYATGSVSGTYYVGGLVGNNFFGTNTNCYANGTVTGASNVGGLTGYGSGTNNNCYATGRVSGTSNVGGLTGSRSGTNNNCFWDIETSEQVSIYGGTGITTAQMKDINTFIAAGWDFAYEEANGIHDVWYMGTIGYPELFVFSDSYQPIVLEGSGTPQTPYLIYDKYDLAAVNQDIFAHYLLMADIDLSGINFNTAVIGTFSGSFDGNGFAVQNLKITGLNNYIGLFGRITRGIVKNLAVQDCDISGRIVVGGLAGAGATNSTIANCFTTGSVRGTNTVGGFIGIAQGTILNCYSSGAPSGTSTVGGFIGSCSGTIINCYSVGTPSGTSYVGGFAASCSGIIINSFWDKIASGINTSAGGTGRTTEEMMLASTFVGWNDGSWTINDGFDYPRLSWENAIGSTIETDFPQATYNGDGSPESPFVIISSDDLVSMSERAPDWDKYFVLANDIDMASRYYLPPAQFGGSFDGKGFTIMNLTIDQTLIGNYSQLGLFGRLTGSVSNLGLSNVSIQGESYIGGVAGYSSGGTINNCYATGNVSGKSYVGGLAGYSSSGTITNCYATGNVSGTSYVGGLVGRVSGTITNCHATGNVSGTGSYVGGLIGYSSSSTITNCYATGNVSGTGSYVGGLAGYSSIDVITNCYAMGSIAGSSYVGGLVGMNSQGKIIRCYSTGNPTGDSNVGGLCGYKSTGGNYEDTDNFWDTQTSGITTSAMGIGKITSQMQDMNTFISAGWDFSNDDGDAADWQMPSNYYPLLAHQTVVMVSVPDVTGLTQIQAVDVLQAAGLDIGNITEAYSGTVVAGMIIRQLPESGSLIPSGYGVNIRISIGSLYSVGDGTADNPYQISTRSDLEAVNDDLAANYILANDIDLAGVVYDRAVIGFSIKTVWEFDGTPFAGTFDGNGYAISNLQISTNSKYHIGLFGYIGEGGTVKNLAVEDCNNIGTWVVGGLAGRNDGGTIINSYVTGSVRGSGHYIGGLAGSNGGLISSCYSIAAVESGIDCAGGLVGHNSANATITDCYATGKVTGNESIGGLTGRSDGTIENCYSLGSVSGAERFGGFVGSNYGVNSNCFWDIQTSDMLVGVGYGSDAGVTGKTTAEMKTQSTFTEWDFDSLWTTSDLLSQFNGYPILRWQKFTVTFDLGANGTIAEGEAVQDVLYGSAAIAPAVTANAGWIFTGWDGVFDSITSDMVITAQYTAQTRVIGLSGDFAFGEVLPGYTKTRELTITNSGNSVLTVSGINYPAGFSGAWSGEIAAGGSQQITVTFAPTVVKFYFGNITVVSDATSGGNSIACSGVGVSRVIALSGQLGFGNVAVGSSVEKIITITNTGVSLLTVTGISYPAGFSGNWSGTIPAGTSKQVAVTFAPASVNSYGGTITISSNATGGTNTIDCSGVGIGAIIRLSGNLAFGDIDIGQPAQTRTFTIHNDGTADMAVSGIVCPNGFSGDWSGTVAAGGSQDVAVSFPLAPLSAQTFAGVITVSSNAVSGQSTIECSGVITARVIAIIGSLSFGDLDVNKTLQKTFTIKNTGNREMTISSITYPEGFTGNWIGGSIAAGSQKYVRLTFAPAAAQLYGGTITVESNATSGVNTIAVSGEGVCRIIAVNESLSFGDVDVYTVKEIPLTIGNTGSRTLKVWGISYPSGFSGTWTGEIAPGASQEVVIKFAPRNMENYGGEITIYSDATEGNNIVNCTGAGVKGIISVSGELFFGHSTIGSQTTLDFTISNSGNRNLTVSGVNCSDGFLCDWSGVVAAGASQQVALTFAPSAQGDYNGVINVVSDSTEGISTLDCYGFVYIGEGTAANPYQLANRYHLEAVNSDLTAFYLLTANINLADIIYDSAIIAPYTDASSPAFTGSLDGDDFNIRNLTIANPDGSYLGVFGRIGSGGIVSNLGIRGASISGLGYIGALTGDNSGTITGVYAGAQVAAIFDYAGTLAGVNSGIITQSCGDGTVTADSFAGGLTADNSGTISDCYAVADVSSVWLAGGLAGVNWGTITNSYSGSIVQGEELSGGFTGVNTNIITGCFWDTETSGQTVSGGAEGKTTAQMRDLQTFTDAAWDFGNIWMMPTGEYPQLKWAFYDQPTPDLDADGVVYVSDVVIMADNWLDTNCRLPYWCGGADLDTDGAVDLIDFATFADFWLTGEAELPDVVGQTQAEAENAITAALFEVGQITEVYSDTVAAGYVISQTPAGGQSILIGSAIDLVVSKGIDPTPDISWVSINDPGFTGDMSKYETTNAQYCMFLNAALITGDIVIEGNYVKGARGDFAGKNYYNLAAVGYTGDGATNGGAARINYTGGIFTVDSGFENHPVTYVSWYGSTAFCNYYGWRLPSEPEWQTVADYDGTYIYGCGSIINNSIANYNGSTHPHGTTAIGTFGTYGYGMADMAGNVREWTTGTVGESRVFRGGSWYHFEYYCTVSQRGYNAPDAMDYIAGFRVCRGSLPVPDITWISISDPGVSGHEGFIGEMSKYETTNAQYCQFLNAALASGDIVVSGSYVVGNSGTYSGQNYYDLAGSGYTGYGATNGGAARINWTGNSFMVDLGFENHPVTYVSFYGATAFAGYYRWRLPTEWEWQAVADYDGNYAYGCGATIDNNIANYLNSTHPHGTTLVGQSGTFGYGLADIAGNVFEWTSTVSGSSRVLRGGCWRSLDKYCTVLHRGGLSPLTMNDHSGFRVCRSVPESVPDITWVSINDPGVSGHEGFIGDMSKYETTNAQYCQFLNAALTTGDIIVDGTTVKGASGNNSGVDFVGQNYYDLAGAGYTVYGATNGGAARINYSGGSFTVDSGFENHPITYVSWYGSTAFCNYYGWRLPTEWEWEAVADYNGSYTYGCDTSLSNSKANYQNSTHPHGTTAVGAFGTYGYGMADIAGNVWEWTDSIYSGSYRVLRGGSWYSNDDYCTVSYRNYTNPNFMHYSLGIRVCR